jgi:hypothetical protein
MFIRGKRFLGSKGYGARLVEKGLRLEAGSLRPEAKG